MKKATMFFLTFLLFAVIVTASTMPMRYTLNFYGVNGIENVTSIKFSDGTNMTTASIGGGFSANATSNLNMTGYNITNVNCIYFNTGNICG